MHASTTMWHFLSALPNYLRNHADLDNLNIQHLQQPQLLFLDMFAHDRILIHRAMDDQNTYDRAYVDHLFPSPVDENNIDQIIQRSTLTKQLKDRLLVARTAYLFIVASLLYASGEDDIFLFRRYLRDAFLAKLVVVPKITRESK